MIDAVWWLGVWEEPDAPGKHDIRLPAPDARGYQYVQSIYGSKIPWNREPVYSMWERVGRAIPVDGTVTDGPPSWHRSPQARFWLEPEKKSLRRRLTDWLKKEAARG